MAAIFDSFFDMGDIRILAAEYRKLPPALARKHVRSAIRKTINPYLPLFRQVAPKRTGGLKRSPITVADYDRVSGNWTGRVGYGMSKKKPGYAALLVNNGTKKRFHKRKTLTGRRHSTGAVRATHFADSMLSTVRSQGLNNLETFLYAGLESALRSLPRYLAAKKR